MHDYQRLALMLSPITEKDLILYDMSAEDKIYAVRQYNHALSNAQKDGTDVAQIILKPLISKYPTWGDLALIFGLCLARETEYHRAEEALMYAVNNTLASEHNLTVAQEAMRHVKDDIKIPKPRTEAPRSGRNWMSMAAADGKPTSRVGMQAPILVKASNRTGEFQMASDRERRDIMMRSAAGGDERGDNVDVENVRTAADNLRLAVRIGMILIAAVALFSLIYWVIIPTAVKIKNSDDTASRLEYVISKLEENKEDPEVGSIIEEYAANFGG